MELNELNQSKENKKMAKKLFVSVSVMFLFLIFMAPGCDQKKPDLVVDNITLTPTNPTTSDQIQFTAVIKNKGKKKATSSVAAMWVGGETDPQQFNIPALTPGAAHTIQRSETLSVPQNYRVKIAADYSHTVTESNESNNETYKKFTVKNPPPLQVIHPTNSRDFQISSAGYVLTVRFNKDVDTSTLVSRSTFIVNFPKDANAAGTFKWQNERTFIWTSTKKIKDLFEWMQDYDFQLTIKDAVKDKLDNTQLDGDKNGTPGGHFVHTYSHGASLPGEEPEPVPMETVENVAMKNAQSLWGEVYASAPIPCYGLDDTLIGYIFNFRKKKPFPHRENLLATLSPDDPLGEKEYCHITLSSVFSESPIEEYGEFLSEELVQEEELEKKAKKALGTASVELKKVYDLGLSVKWYLFAGGGDRVYIRLLPPVKVYSEEEFNVNVRDPLRRQRAVEWKAYQEIADALPPKDYKQDWLDQRDGIGLIGDEVPDDDVEVKNARGGGSWHYRRIPRKGLMPFYDWHRGCTPTAAAMCFGYYDRIGAEPGYKHLSLLVSYHRNLWDSGENQMDYHVPDILLTLAQKMHTDSSGWTCLYDISQGIEQAAVTKYVFCQASGHGPGFWDATYKDDLRNAVSNGQPSIMTTSNHSVAVVGYKKKDHWCGDEYEACVHDTHLGTERWHKCKWFYKLHTINCIGVDDIHGGSVELHFPEGDTRYEDEGGAIAIGSNQVFLTGHSYDITWKTSRGAGFGTVSVYFWDGDSSTFLGDSNTGKFTWNIPLNLNPTNSGRIDLKYWSSSLGDEHYNLYGEDGSYGPFYVLTGLPDLVAEDINISPPSSPTITDNYGFSASIKNIGNVDAHNITNTIKVGGESNPTPININYLPKGGERVWIHDNFNTLTLGHKYRVEAMADSLDQITESDNNNNMISKVFGCDLVVQSLTVTPGAPTTADEIHVVGEIANIGSIASAPMVASLQVGGGLHYFNLPIIKPGSSVTIEHKITLGVAKGYYAWARVDINNDNSELRENNNEMNRYFEVTN
jgi:hypothetical protein